MWKIILVRPEKVSNLGAVCRLIMNFQAQGLILVDSKIDATDLEMIMTARRAMNIFYDAIHVSTLDEALSHVSYSVATTARVANYKSPRRMALLLEEIPWEYIGASPALVFGPESTGLLNNELDLCNMLITIPTSKEYPALNLSHAVAIILAQLYQKQFVENLDKSIEEMEKTENWQPQEKASPELLDLLFKSFETYNLTFVETYKQEITRQIFRNIISRAKLSKKEASRLVGTFEAWEYPFKNQS